MSERAQEERFQLIGNNCETIGEVEDGFPQQTSDMDSAVAKNAYEEDKNTNYKNNFTEQIGDDIRFPSSDHGATSAAQGEQPINVEGNKEENMEVDDVGANLPTERDTNTLEKFEEQTRTQQFEWKQERERLSAELEENKRSNCRIAAELEENKRRFEEQIRSLHFEWKQDRERLSGELEENKRGEKLKEELNEELNTKTHALAASENQKTKLEKELSKLSAEISKRNEDVKTGQIKVEMLTKEKNKLETNNRRQENDIKILKKQVQELTTGKNKLETNNRRQENDLKRLEKQVQELTTGCDKQQEEISNWKCIYQTLQTFTDQEIRKRDQEMRNLTTAFQRLEREKQDLTLRLSKLAGANLTYNNPNIADLSDENRPTQLAELFSELYDNEWTDAFEVIQTENEKEKTRLMLHILKTADQLCTYASQSYVKAVEQGFTELATTIEEEEDVKQLESSREATTEVNGTPSAGVLSKIENGSQSPTEHNNSHKETTIDGTKTNEAAGSQPCATRENELGAMGVQHFVESPESECSPNTHSSSVRGNSGTETIVLEKSENGVLNESRRTSTTARNPFEDQLTNPVEDTYLADESRSLSNSKTQSEKAPEQLSLEIRNMPQPTSDNDRKYSTHAEQGANDDSSLANKAENPTTELVVTETGNKRAKNDCEIASTFEPKPNANSGDLLGNNCESPITGCISPEMVDERKATNEAETWANKENLITNYAELLLGEQVKENIQPETGADRGSTNEAELDDSNPLAIEVKTPTIERQSAQRKSTNEAKQIANDVNQIVNNVENPAAGSVAACEYHNTGTKVDAFNLEHGTKDYDNNLDDQDESLNAKQEETYEANVQAVVHREQKETCEASVQADVHRETKGVQTTRYKTIRTDYEQLPNEQKKAISETRNIFKNKMWKDLKEVSTRFIVESLKQVYQDEENLLKYIRKCLELCWQMCRHEPPVYIHFPKSTTNMSFDTNKYKPYTKTGKHLDFVVWPALYLHEGGPILSKGVAQGMK